ncbi:MAG TPA: DNA-processing protein DprA [Acidimicrobiales bacterium]|nr:DNA-processing protein DprA [Acidimicrobiales bacterium]
MEPEDPDYADGLRELRTPPSLWLDGMTPAGPLVAVVGTRHPDRAGLELAGRLARELVERGYGVVSGLAPGIDAAAHRGALEAGGRTWAILGCGVDVLPWAGAAELARRIPGAGGLLAEVPPGTHVSTRALVARDRLQSAMSAATVIVQTDLRSGTMHTARFSVLQGRPLVVVAPPGTAGAGAAGAGAAPAGETRAEAWAGNAALCDPAGCDPARLHATGAAGRLVAARRPVADLVLERDGPWSELWERLHRG